MPNPWDSFLEEQATNAAQDWFRQQCRNPYAHLHLYFRPSDGPQAGALVVAEQAPEGCELATGERISPAWTKEQARSWIYCQTRRLPILAA